MRSFRLPGDVDARLIGADFNDGVLTLNLPKTSPAKREEKKITVRRGLPAIGQGGRALSRLRLLARLSDDIGVLVGIVVMPGRLVVTADNGADEGFRLQRFETVNFRRGHHSGTTPPTPNHTSKFN